MVTKIIPSYLSTYIAIANRLALFAVFVLCSSAQYVGGVETAVMALPVTVVGA